MAVRPQKSEVIVYGIRNCDTVRSAREWLTEHGIDFRFHDYRKDGIDRTLLDRLESKFGWDNMLNRRSASWRKIDPEKRCISDALAAKSLMLELPTVIRRPILEYNSRFIAGFTPTEYQAIL